MSSLLRSPDTTVIPIEYCPRKWAGPVHNSFKRWMAIVLHRRAGKTTAILNHHQRAALNDEWESARLRHLLPDISTAQVKELLKGRTYWHGMPIREQITLTGVWDLAKEISSVVPGVYKNESKLLIEYPNGNKLQLIGLDDPDRKRGPALSGLSLDEYSQIAPNAFGEVLSKSLADHLGYCIFSGTIKGKDQLYHAYERNKLDPDWFTLWQDIDESLRTEDGATIMALKQALADDRQLVASGMMTQGEFDQEWYLSHEAAIKGSFYADILRTIRQNGQVCRVPFDPSLPVDTDWDLGIDAMAIWFTQSTRSGEVRVIDYHEDIGGGLIECIKALEGRQANPTNDTRIENANARRRRYAYGEHWGPHDIETREISTGQSRRQTAHEHGLDFKITERLAVDEGIEAVMRFLSRCYFDEQHCERGLDGLLHYKRTWQKTLSQFSGVPVHDWACMAGDTKVLTRHGTYQIQYLPESGEVLTRCGWKRYENPRITRTNAPLVEVAFRDGLTVRCTPEHRFLTANGWRFASDLTSVSLIQSGSIRSHIISQEESIDYGLKNITGHAAEQGFIGKCGEKLLAIFRQVATFITKMGTRPIITFPILNACPPQSIYLANGINQSAIGLSAFQSEPVRRQRNGIALLQVGYGISDTLKSKNSAIINVFARFANIVARAIKDSLVKAAISKNIVHSPVKLCPIANVRLLSETADVWCLTVPDAGEWALENGAIVHNSHPSDSFRGLAVRHKVPLPPTPKTRLYPERGSQVQRSDHPGSFMR